VAELCASYAAYRLQNIVGASRLRADTRERVADMAPRYRSESRNANASLDSRWIQTGIGFRSRATRADQQRN